MSEPNDNIAEKDPSALLAHLATTRATRIAVTKKLKAALAVEQNLELKNLLQAATDLLQLDDHVTVHFET